MEVIEIHMSVATNGFLCRQPHPFVYILSMAVCPPHQQGAVVTIETIWPSD